jgi:hypothetical protein
MVRLRWAIKRVGDKMHCNFSSLSDVDALPIDAGPRHCDRISCSYNSAIHWCNDVGFPSSFSLLIPRLLFFVLIRFPFQAFVKHTRDSDRANSSCRMTSSCQSTQATLLASPRTSSTTVSTTQPSLASSASLVARSSKMTSTTTSWFVMLLAKFAPTSLSFLPFAFNIHVRVSKQGLRRILDTKTSVLASWSFGESS